MVVGRTGYELFHVGGEAYGRHGVFVAAEGSLEGGVRDGGHGVG